jgi:hypothetical protein
MCGIPELWTAFIPDPEFRNKMALAVHHCCLPFITIFFQVLSCMGQHLWQKGFRFSSKTIFILIKCGYFVFPSRSEIITFFVVFFAFHNPRSRPTSFCGEAIRNT